MQLQNISTSAIDLGYICVQPQTTFSIDLNQLANIATAALIDQCIAAGQLQIVAGTEGPLYTTQKPGPIQTFAWTVGAIANGAAATQVSAWASAKMGDLVIVNATTDIGVLEISGAVSSAGNVRFQIQNNSGGSITPGAIVVRAMLIH